MDEEMGRILSSIAKWFGIILFILAVFLLDTRLDLLGKWAIFFAVGSWISSLVIAWSSKSSPQIVPVPTTQTTTSLRTATTYRSTSRYDDACDDEFWGEGQQSDPWGDDFIFNWEPDPLTANFVCGMDYTQPIFRD